MGPGMAVARELLRAGDSVAFFCYDNAPRLAARLQREGLEVPCFSPEPGGSSETNNFGQRRRTELTRRLQNPSWRQVYYERLLIYTAVPQVAAIRQAIREYAPDLFCTDALSYAGAIAAELEGVPWASVATSLDFAAPNGFGCDLRTVLEQLESKRFRLATDFGVRLRFHWSNVVSPHVNLTFSIEELTPKGDGQIPNTRMVGCCHPGRCEAEIAFPWERLDAAKPLVYISSGTELRFDAAVVIDLIEAAVAAGAQVVAAMVEPGELGAVGDLPSVICVGRAPQLGLLNRAALFVTHGGTNSIMEGMAAGVPLLVMPLSYDQPLNGMFVERAGLGRVLDPWNWNRRRGTAAVTALLSPGAAERGKAAALRTAARQSDGGRTGAAVLRAAAAGPHRWIRSVCLNP